MKLARAETEKHGNIGLGLGGLAFEFGDVADILKLGLGFANILTRFTTKSSEDVTALFLSTNLDEPSR